MVVAGVEAGGFVIVISEMLLVADLGVDKDKGVRLSVNTEATISVLQSGSQVIVGG